MCGISQNPDTGNYIIVSQDEYCEKCSKQYTNIHDKWCLCQNNLTNWSGNKKIDELIQEMHLKINKSDIIISIVVEWIPYNQFINIKETAKDNNNTAIIYLAILKNGPLLYTNKEWIRNSYTSVVLKCLDTNEFFSKASNYNDIYGISQNPNTKEYIIVLSNNEYCEKCEMQLKIIDYSDKIVEWIPYNQFINITEIGKVDDNTAVYSAIWKNGPLYYKKKWIRKSNEKVVLNYLTLDIKEFFNKV
uniref:Uncharacterized protein n=1 Tax=Rhizophagus irregularis (strain DAOM 181602 / DAOM 197198 / MUCL 43194) TaxID=747089 RepID=U9UYW7_RHIID